MRYITIINVVYYVVLIYYLYESLLVSNECTYLVRKSSSFKKVIRNVTSVQVSLLCVTKAMTWTIDPVVMTTVVMTTLSSLTMVEEKRIDTPRLRHNRLLICGRLSLVSCFGIYIQQQRFKRTAKRRSSVIITKTLEGRGRRSKGTRYYDDDNNMELYQDNEVESQVPNPSTLPQQLMQAILSLLINQSIN